MNRAEKAENRGEVFKGLKEEVKNKNVNNKIREQLAGKLSEEILLDLYSNIICKSDEIVYCSSETAAIEEIMHNNYFILELDIEFKCIYMKGNKSWISKSSAGQHRYFSKNKVTGEHFSFSIIDMFGILGEYRFSEALNMALAFTNIKIEEDEWKKEHIDKYLYNLDFIEHASSRLSKYSNLNKFVSKNLVVLEQISKIGQSNIKSILSQVDERDVFFASTRYIANFLELSKSNVSRILNMYAVLGLITKISEQDIPDDLYLKAESKFNDENKEHMVAFFSIPTYSDKVLKEANYRAGMLLENKINTSKISDKTISEILGQTIADEVFGNTRVLTKRIIKSKAKSLERTNMERVKDENKVREENIEERYNNSRTKPKGKPLENFDKLDVIFGYS